MTEPTGTLAKAYAPAEFEHEIYERWLGADVFAPDGAGSTTSRSSGAAVGPDDGAYAGAVLA